MRVGYIELNAQSPSNCQVERTNGANPSENGGTLWSCQQLDHFSLGNGKECAEGASHAFFDLSRNLIRRRTQTDLKKTRAHHQARKHQVATLQIKQSLNQAGGEHAQGRLGQSRNRRGMAGTRPRRSEGNFSKERANAAVNSACSRNLLRGSEKQTPENNETI